MPQDRYASPEREAMLRELWPTPMRNDDIRILMNTLPGKEFKTRKSLSDYAFELKIKRAPEGVREPEPPPKPILAYSAPEPPKPAPRPSSKPFSMSFMLGPDPRSEAWLKQVMQNRFSLTEETRAPLDVTYSCKNVKGV